jgi:DNA-binding NarL/FixJ family response regulator
LTGKNASMRGAHSSTERVAAARRHHAFGGLAFEFGALLETIEETYQVDRPAAAWLGSITQACRTMFQERFGVAGFEYFDDGPRGFEVVHVASAGMVNGLADLTRVVEHVLVRPPIVRPTIWGLGAKRRRHHSECDELPENPAMQRWSQRYGMSASLWLLAPTPAGVGCALHASSPRARGAPERIRNAWRQLALHLALAQRLRQRLQPVATRCKLPATSRAEPDSLTAYQSKQSVKRLDAVQALRHAVRAADQELETTRRAEPGAALDASAGWTLLDEFEADGSGFVVVRQRLGTSTRQKLLTGREREVVSLAARGHANKTIADLLGVEHSTVRVLLHRAAAKLGVRTRSDAIVRFRLEQRTHGDPSVE